MILGAGRVGESVAESLVSERNDITVIDTDPVGVFGNGIQPSVLRGQVFQTPFSLPDGTPSTAEQGRNTAPEAP